MAPARRVGLLLSLLLPVVSASMPGTVVRLNRAVLSYVSEIGKAPLQQALNVTVPYFLDWNGEVHQPTRIQTLNIRVSHFHLKFVADFGVRLLVAANFTFKVFRVPEPLELMLPVVVLADAHVAQGSIGTPVVSISACFPLFSNASVSHGSSSVAPGLLALVQKHVRAVLRNKLCLSVSNLVQGLNVHLGTLIGLNPVGPESQIRYSMISVPNITKDYISLDINVVNLSLQLSVSKLKLRGTTSVLGDIQLAVASSNVGFIDTDQVHPLMDAVFKKPLLDHLNALLGMGIALPNVVNLHYVDTEVFVYEGYVVISSGLLYQR
uniref:BPI fold-containing family B member 2 n=1 Tax=Panthera onca TaxID=9690 RepID=UPI002955B531|nr:BPI fold-containing family B member 2 [Panthera onca]